MIPAAPYWSHLLEEARRLAALRGDPFSTDVFECLGDLIRFASAMSPEPVVSLGDQATLWLDWPGMRLQLLEDRIEVWSQLAPHPMFPDWCEPHRPGAPFSSDFARALPKIPGWDAKRPDRP